MKNRIKQVRKERDLTQVEFGEKIGVKGNTITNYENGLRNPTDAVIRSICREFSINESWLRTGEGEKDIDKDIEFGEICFQIAKDDPKARRAICDYWHLSPEDKELWWKFMERFMKGDGV